MTAISAIIDRKNKKTYLASDQMGSDRFTGENFKTKKIFHNGKLTFAICGSYRLGQVLQHNLSPRPFQEGETIEKYVFDYLEKHIRDIFRERKCLKTVDSVEVLGNAEFIVAVKDRIFILQDDLAFLEPEKIFATSGSGKYHQEASIYTQLQLAPKKDLKEVLKDAIRYTSDVVISVGGTPQVIEHKH